jgi:hypothetical protein
MIDSGIPTLAGLLVGTDYPATRDDLLRLARSEGADGDVVALLQTLPNQSFNGTWDVHHALHSDLAAAS